MRWTTSALKIVLVYFVAASAWVVLSDFILAGEKRPTFGREMILRVEVAKGMFFVLITSVLLFILIQRGMRLLIRSENRTRAVIRSMADAVLLLNEGFEIVQANESAASLFGYQCSDDLLGRHFQNLMGAAGFHDRDGHQFGLGTDPFSEIRVGRVLQDMPVLSGGSKSTQEGEREERVLSLSASAVLEPESDQRYVVTLRDMTQFRKLERLRDEFLSIAAHELKTPLSIVKANEQMVLRFGKSWDFSRVVPLLQVVDRQCDRMTRLIQELLEVSRLRLSQFDLNVDRFDLVALVRNVVDRMKLRTTHHSIVFRQDGLSHDETSLWWKGDALRLDLVIENLLDNAIKYSPSGGWIDVTLRQEKDSVVISVRDRGIGIPASRRDQIFRRFYRAHPEQGADYSGFGIGLSLSREIVERHGGHISFESEEGKGTRFDIHLPRRMSGQKEVRADAAA